MKGETAVYRVKMRALIEELIEELMFDNKKKTVISVLAKI